MKRKFIEHFLSELMKVKQYTCRVKHRVNLIKPMTRSVESTNLESNFKDHIPTYTSVRVSLAAHAELSFHCHMILSEYHD